MKEEQYIQLYYWYEADNFLLYFPGDFFEPRWMGTPRRKMIFHDPKVFKQQRYLFKSEQNRKCHLRLIDKQFCLLKDLV